MNAAQRSPVLSNRAFSQALVGLVHPLTIATIFVLLFNDHWLRWHHPSWLTGKLGDFAWLIFAPFIAAIPLSLLIPRRIPHHERLVHLLSLAFVGLWFALAKIIPFVHAVTVNLWESIIGWQGSLRMDATDLLALPALLVYWWIWKQVAGEGFSLKPYVYVVFALGIVATLASDSPNYHWSDSGITHICQEDGLLVTRTEARPDMVQVELEETDEVVYPDDPTRWRAEPRMNVFRSSDGGLTWIYSLEPFASESEGDCSSLETDLVVDPHDPSIQYRWIAGERIEHSTDGGNTWSLDYELFELQQDVRRYYNHYSIPRENFSDYSSYYIPSPVSGIVDHETGNLLLAMSWDGILVRTASDGQWQWIAVRDSYQLANIQGFSQIDQLLFFELWLSFAMAFLIITTSIAYIHQRQMKPIRKVLLGIGWISWFIIGILLFVENVSAASHGGRDIGIGLVALPLLVFLAIPLSVGAVWDLLRNFRNLANKIGLVAFGVGLLFLFPFILWTQGTIPRYTTALIFAVILVVSGLAAAYMYLRSLLPVLEKPMPKKPLSDEAGSEIQANGTVDDRT